VNRDDIGCQHLEHQEPIVHHCHEAVQRQPTEDKIEGEVELHDGEGNDLHVVVLHHPKGDEERDGVVMHDEV
jgi:hypothetical protein